MCRVNANLLSSLHPIHNKFNDPGSRQRLTPFLNCRITPATKCGYCSNSKCCQYITQKISTPRSKSDFNYLLWQASHENITIFQDDEGWNLLVTTRCSHLQTGGRCGIYATRPTVCRNYTNDYCEFEGPAEEGYKRCFHGYNELLEYCQQRFKHWDENAASQ